MGRRGFDLDFLGAASSRFSSVRVFRSSIVRLLPADLDWLQFWRKGCFLWKKNQHPNNELAYKSWSSRRNPNCAFGNCL